MNGRERVRRCLEFERPDRVPRQLWLLPIAEHVYGRAALAALRRRWPEDIVGTPDPTPAPAGLCRGDRTGFGEYRDEWGCVFENLQSGIVGQVKTPLLADYAAMDRLQVPVALLDVDTAAVNRACAAADQFVLAAATVNPFERLQFLRGSENLYMDLALDPPELTTLTARVHQFYLQLVDSWCRTDVDGIVIGDDWGSQRGLLIAPDQWRCRFKPLYAEYAARIRAAGKKVFMHSDGCIADIYPDLIEIGVDAVNSQLFCMDIEEIGRRFQGRITFWGELDRQRILTSAEPEEVRAAVARVVQALYSVDGGVIAQFEFGAGTTMVNAETALQAWLDLTAAQPGSG